MIQLNNSLVLKFSPYICFVVFTFIEEENKSMVVKF